MQRKSLKFQPMDVTHLREAVDILIEFEKDIDKPFTSLLGKRYLEQVLFKEFIEAPGSFGYVAVLGEKVIGFAIAASNSTSVYHRIIQRHFIRNVITVFTQTFRYPILAKRIIEVMLHLASKHDKPIPDVEQVKAEFFSFHLSPECHSPKLLGNIKAKVSDVLFWMVLNQFHKLGIPHFKAVTSSRNYRMKIFYKTYKQTRFISQRLLGEKKLIYIINVETALNSTRGSNVSFI